MGILTFILWWGTLPLQVVLSWTLLRRGVFRTFPWFVAYTLFSVAATAGRFVVRNNDDLYRVFYWTTDAVYALLGIAVLYEVFRTIFRSFRGVWWFRPIFPLAAVLAILLTAVRTQTSPAGPHTRIVEWIVASEMGVRFLQVLVFVILVVLVTVFGLRWRQHAFGICAGYGIYATVALLATTEFYEIGTKFRFAWGIISIVAYNAAVLIWLWYFSGHQETELPRTDHPPLSAQELGRYKEIVRRVRRP